MSYTGRRRYQQMANARGRLNARGVQLSAEEIAAIEREEEARLEAARTRQAKPRERIYHPAIKAPEHKCYRVLRQWKDSPWREDIAACKTELQAWAVLDREKGWAIVVDPNGKRVAHNGQPMTERP